MCKVYNTIGSLTAIKSHLRKNFLDEFKSLNELINFQKNYSVTRQQIITDHTKLIEQEKIILCDELVQLNDSIRIRKSEVEQQLQLEIEKLKLQLINLPSTHSNVIQLVVNYVKKFCVNYKIRKYQLNFNSGITQSVEHLTNLLTQKNNRYQNIHLNFSNAVNESSFYQLKELERKKRIIDEINSSIYGALGEQKVVRELEKLPDDYFLINDFTYSFYPPIYDRQENEYIKSIQIDHLLISSSGIFLIETKNWSEQSIKNINLRSPVHQIKRASFALYKILSDGITNNKLTLHQHHWGDRKVPVKNLIVLINHKPNEEFQHVKTLTLNELLSYIKYFKPNFSGIETQMIANYLLSFTTRKMDKETFN